jgi:hypothetical protein
MRFQHVNLITKPEPSKKRIKPFPFTLTPEKRAILTLQLQSG